MLLKFIKIICMFFIIILFAGCTPYINKNVSINDPNATVDASSNKGFFALSSACIGAKSMTIIYRKAQPAPVQAILSGDMSNSVPLQLPCDQNTNIFLVQLPAGQYFIAHLFMEDQYNVDNFKFLYFNILAGKVSYIGSILVKATMKRPTFKEMIAHFDPSYGKVNYVVINSANTDIPFLLKRYKYIPKNAYLIMKPTVNR